MTRPISRRRVLKTLSVGVGFWSFGVAPSRADKSPNEKLNIACIGVGNRGAANVAGVRSENIAYLCDVDDRQGGKTFQQYPKAKKYYDFRRLLDKEHKHIDAVVVSTPDHTHAPATAMALQLGKPVYCEKPLTHTVFEARRVAQLAQQAKVATQMGTQIHAGENYRRVVEIIQAGTIGPVHEVHVWVAKAWGGGDRPKQTPPVPKTLKWDLWLGPAPYRPYHPAYVPFNWRRWWDFGNGTLGDMACHYMDLPFWALGLRHPETIQAQRSPLHPETCPLGLQVEYHYPARGNQPPVKLIWYDGNRIPKTLFGHKMPGAGVMFVGKEGQMYANYSTYRLFPEEKFRGFEPPPRTIPRSMGHHREWIHACKTGASTTCHFGYAGPLTEAVLLGVVAFRSGQKLRWNHQEFTTGNDQADRMLHKEYRSGWKL